MTVYIYCLVDPRSNEIRYVGKTVNLRSRFYSHCHDGCSNIHKRNWFKALRKAKLEPLMDVLETIENSNDRDWQDVEVFWISYLRFIGCRLLNVDNGGRGGVKRSPETVAKMSASLKGKSFHTPESRAKISAWLRNRVLSEEARGKISKANSGKVRSSAVREHLRDVNLGRKASEETKAKMRQSHLGTKMNFSADALAKIRAVHLGRKHTKEARRKISEARRARSASFPVEAEAVPPLASAGVQMHLAL